MTDSLRHRGPDGEGHHRSGNAAIGHRRLSIIDIATGAQPMSNEDGTVWATFNGEIYNFRELRSQLAAAGHVFRTHSDTEVLAHGYEEWDTGLVGRLRGMFAFAILDQGRSRLLLARDHFGIKPLVYHWSPERFAFASEIKALLVDPRLERGIDEDALADYLEYGYVPAPKSIFRNVRKLLPGHFMVVDVKRPAPARVERYWRLDFASPPGEVSESAAAEQLRHLLAESVRGQMVSDVPLGAMLSGGIDSSAVVSMMARAAREPVKTFSIGFNEERFSETRFARLVAEVTGTDHHEHTVTPDIADLLPRLVYHFDEPFADASAVPTFYLCRMAREHVTVALSGDGGDELFAGYDRYRRCMSAGSLDWIPRRMHDAIFGPLSSAYPRSLPGRGWIDRAMLNADERFVDVIRQQYGSVDVSAFLNSTLAAALSGRSSFAYLKAALDPANPDVLHRYLQADVETYLPNDILAKVDITSMMNSLEVRVPLLDHEFAQYVARLPSRMKLKRGTSKYIFKKALQPLLPREVLDRPKMGFGVPMRQWVNRELRDIVQHYLQDSPKISGLLDRSLLRKMVEDNERNVYGSKYGGKLWWALFFEMWHQDVYSQRLPGTQSSTHSNNG